MKGEKSPQIGQERKDPGKKQPPLRSRLWTWTGFADKTLWDWLQLLSALAIPVVLAIAGFWFTSQQDERQQRFENQRAQQAQKIENQRAEAERELAQQRAQDAALQAYLDQMGSLLLGNGLRESEEGSEERTLARARTLTALGRLDPGRKTALIQFLVEANLVQGVEGKAPIITLRGANLSNANLRDADLVEANLKGADLRHANLDGADLRGADLAEAELSDGDLVEANLSGANLSNASLRNANLRGADPVEVNLRDADLRYANLTDADLSLADLTDADLSDADLARAVLTGADLTGADLSEADLYLANLSGAVGVGKELLKQQAKSIFRATMPDGTEILSKRYANFQFEPALSLRLNSADWQNENAAGTPDSLHIWSSIASGLGFTNPLQVFDPSSLSEPKKLPAPENAEDWVSWFQRHPNLDTSKPAPTSVGDASGKRIDVTVTSTPENLPRKVCGELSCVPLYPLSHKSGLDVWEGDKDRLILVDVKGETVLIDVYAPEDKFDEFLPKAQKVLDSVEWESGLTIASSGEDMENRGPS